MEYWDDLQEDTGSGFFAAFACSGLECGKELLKEDDDDPKHILVPWVRFLGISPTPVESVADGS